MEFCGYDLMESSDQFGYFWLRDIIANLKPIKMKLKIESNSLTPKTIVTEDGVLFTKIDELNGLISNYYQDLDFY